MRPTKYTEELGQRLIELMREGASIQEVCYELGICKQTLYNWCEQHPEFLDSKKRGTDFSEGWWMKQGRINLENKDFSATLFYMNMKNRFGWADKQEIDHTTGGERIGNKIIVSKEEAQDIAKKLYDDV